jgi:hypothetical protein
MYKRDVHCPLENIRRDKMKNFVENLNEERVYSCRPSKGKEYLDGRKFAVIDISCIAEHLEFLDAEICKPINNLYKETTGDDVLYMRIGNIIDEQLEKSILEFVDDENARNDYIAEMKVDIEKWGEYFKKKQGKVA